MLECFSSRHPRGHSVTGLAWNPSPVFNGELVFADNYGYVGQLKNFLSSAGLTTDKKPAKVCATFSIILHLYDSNFASI